jgi:methyltransferase (TIGR00027 family)
MSIEHISDTALWVAVYRARETERRDAIFRDPYARRLAGCRGEEIARGLGKSRASGSGVVVRTAVFDERIRDAVSNRRVDLVANLGAGLDARPWRLPLPPSLRWVDVDLPDILAYKQDMLRGERPACRYEAIGADLTDAAARTALFAQLGAEASRALVITEGLLIYLAADQVATLARDLATVTSFREWLLDLASPDLLRILNRDWGPALARGHAPFRFAPAEGPAFFGAFGWREAEYRSQLEEGRRLGREMRLMWFWRLLSRFAPPERREVFRRMMGFVRLERDGSPPGAGPGSLTHCRANS